MLVDGRDDVDDRTVEPGRVILNHHVPSIKKAAARLDELGARWVSRVEYRDAGLWFGTVEDPDGNYVQLIETTPEYWKLKSERAGAAAGPLVHARAAIRLPAQDLERARRWYAEKLGLEPVEERDGGLRYVCSDTEFVVFASTGKPSGDHTQMGLTVPDLDLAVGAAAPAGRGVRRRHRGRRWPLPVNRSLRRARDLVQRQRGQPDRAGGVRLLIVSAASLAAVMTYAFPVGDAAPVNSCRCLAGDL